MFTLKFEKLKAYRYATIQVYQFLAGHLLVSLVVVLGDHNLSDEEFIQLVLDGISGRALLDLPHHLANHVVDRISPDHLEYTIR